MFPAPSPEEEAREDEKYWELYGFVIASEYRRKVLHSLHHDEKTPGQIAKETSLYPSHVSSALAELIRKELVVCKNPRLRKGKVFGLTDFGSDLADKIE